MLFRSGLLNLCLLASAESKSGQAKSEKCETSRLRNSDEIECTLCPKRIRVSYPRSNIRTANDTGDVVRVQGRSVGPTDDTIGASLFVEDEQPVVSSAEQGDSRRQFSGKPVKRLAHGHVKPRINHGRRDAYIDERRTGGLRAVIGLRPSTA